VATGVQNFIINANADFSQQLFWLDQNGNPINLTGYSAKMEIANFAGPGRTVYYTMTSPSGGITIPTPATGEIDLFIPASVTETFTFANAVYDLLLISGTGAVTRFLEGPITLSLGVTTP
jgi:hypothetical protein